MSNKTLHNSLTKLAKKTGDKIMVQIFNGYKDIMIREFLSHPVTVELQVGKNSRNISGTLSGGHRNANLFTFIGFEDGHDPIKPILNLLEETRIEYIGAGSKNPSAKYRIHIPTREDIFEVTPMPWAEGRSWARGIEHGISGLGFFLPKNKHGRSGGGIQMDQSATKGKGIKFKNRPYISEILNNFHSKIKKIKL